MKYFAILLFLLSSVCHAAFNSNVVYVVDKDKRPLYDINADKQIPIASITKLMTAIVILDANQSLEDQITIKQMDKDTIKNTNSRLNYGTKLTRKQLLLLALMSSENRAAAALVRNYPKGSKAAIKAMNKKAIELGMYNTKFVDGTGLSAKNVSTAKDLAILVDAAAMYPTIIELSTTSKYTAKIGKRTQTFKNTNPLIRNENGNDILISKTGFTNEAGKCIIVKQQDAVIILMDSPNSQTRLNDLLEVRKELRN